MPTNLQLLYVLPLITLHLQFITKCLRQTASSSNVASKKRINCNYRLRFPDKESFDRENSATRIDQMSDGYKIRYDNRTPNNSQTALVLNDCRHETAQSSTDEPNFTVHTSVQKKTLT